MVIKYAQSILMQGNHVKIADCTCSCNPHPWSMPTHTNATDNPTRREGKAALGESQKTCHSYIKKMYARTGTYVSE